MSVVAANRMPEAGRDAPAPWHEISGQDACGRLQVSVDSGLQADEAAQRLRRFGPNAVRVEEPESLWHKFLEELREPMILLLLVTGALYAVWGKPADAVTMFVVIFLLVGTEVLNEHRADAAVAALRKLSEPTATVRRGGAWIDIPAESVVPGDIVRLDTGRRVPADGRLLVAYALSVDESSLTGESAPVEKDAARILATGTALAERSNMVYAGTVITRGRGTAVTVATGKDTELGRVAGLAAEAVAPRTPLQEAMGNLSRWLAWLAIGFSVLVPLLGWLLAGQDPRQMVLTGLSLAFSVIPEELPIIVTMVLALGAYRLSQRHAIVRRLPAVETLGAVTVIATDKTGTLTENQMELSRVDPAELSAAILEIGVLCNDAAERGGRLAGDPLDTALLRAAEHEGVHASALRGANPLRTEFSFDNTRRLMSAVYQRNGRLWVACKGAPESVLERSTHRLLGGSDAPAMTAEVRQAALANAGQMAAEGARVLAFAEKTIPDGAVSETDAESDLTYVGLAEFADPPRPEVRQAIAACRGAGIRTLMVTGDYPVTARAVARQIGLDESGQVLTGPELDALAAGSLGDAVERVSVFARTTPEHKLKIVRALHEKGERVAVTGDGVNDAPALAAADIGVAMGETGTDVARAAADIVLADDNFATIVGAIDEGRLMFANLTKGVRYYLACKVALVSIVLLPVLLRAPVPFSPIQIILMEMFMDLAASAAFVAEPAEPGLMRRPPRDPKAPFMNRAMVTGIFSSAAGLFAAVSAAYLQTWYASGDLARAQTAAFVTWLLGHVLLALNMRSEREPLFRIGPLSNRIMAGWAAATAAFVMASTLIPGARTLFRTAPLSGREWAMVVVFALAGTFWMEVWKVLRGTRPRAGVPAAPQAE